MTKNEKKWAENYELLKEYIAEHRQLQTRRKSNIVRYSTGGSTTAS